MSWKRATGLLVICALLFGLLPVYAVARTALSAEFYQKENPVELLLLQSELVEGEMVTVQSVRPGRIYQIFEDPALAAVIADVFGVTVQNFVTQSDLNRILAFPADGKGIQSLSGMQYLHALREVSLNNNRISDLSPLRGLETLERLLLDNNQIRDLAPLRSLTNLNWLWLDHNQIRDLSPLANLIGLEWLTLWGNRIEDITPLRYMAALNALWLAENQIRGIEPLRDLRRLETLSLANNQIGDLSPLVGMTRMQLLWLGRQDIRLPQVMRTDPFEQPNVVVDVDGISISPEAISNEGVYTDALLRWTGLTEEVERVSYRFSHYATVGAVTEYFYGTVTQPLAATPFTDVRRGDWFYVPIAFVFRQNLMSGTTATTFSPEADLTRAMGVTMLHRMAGAPEVRYRAIFEDVRSGAWYAEAAVWAYEVGVVQGLGRSDRFAPLEPITREQFAVMLHRYAEWEIGTEPPPPGFTLDRFTDRAEISGWAYEALAWSVVNNLMTGLTPTTLAPEETTSRAASAAILMRYLHSLED